MTIGRIIGQATDAAPTVTLEPGGVVMMILSILIVCLLAAYCIWHILREKSPGEHHHAPLDIDTGDVER